MKGATAPWDRCEVFIHLYALNCQQHLQWLSRPHALPPPFTFSLCIQPEWVHKWCWWGTVRWNCNEVWICVWFRRLKIQLNATCQSLIASEFSILICSKWYKNNAINVQTLPILSKISIISVLSQWAISAFDKPMLTQHIQHQSL